MPVVIRGPAHTGHKQAGLRTPVESSTTSGRLRGLTVGV